MPCELLAHFGTHWRTRFVCIQPDGGSDPDTHASAERPPERLRRWLVGSLGRVLSEL